MDCVEADNIATSVIGKVDFTNSALAHKGVNWYAKEILSIIDFETVA